MQQAVGATSAMKKRQTGPSEPGPFTQPANAIADTQKQERQLQ